MLFRNSIKQPNIRSLGTQCHWPCAFNAHQIKIVQRIYVMCKVQTGTIHTLPYAKLGSKFCITMLRLATWSSQIAPKEMCQAQIKVDFSQTDYPTYTGCIHHCNGSRQINHFRYLDISWHLSLDLLCTYEGFCPVSNDTQEAIVQSAYMWTFPLLHGQPLGQSVDCPDQNFARNIDAY